MTIGQDFDDYGATFTVVDADTLLEAVAHGVEVFSEAVEKAGMPEWPIVHVKATRN